MQMRAQNCMMTRDLDASREQDLESTCIHRSPVASAGWLPAGHRSRLLPAPANQSTSLMTRRLLSRTCGRGGDRAREWPRRQAPGRRARRRSPSRRARHPAVARRGGGRLLSGRTTAQARWSARAPGSIYGGAAALIQEVRTNGLAEIA